MTVDHSVTLRKKDDESGRVVVPVETNRDSQQGYTFGKTVLKERV